MPTTTSALPILPSVRIYLAIYLLNDINDIAACSAGRQSYFLELVGATLVGKCADGSDKWVSLSNEGTINESSNISFGRMFIIVI